MAALAYGSHAVGFLLQPVRDHSRHVGPLVDFEGRPGPAEPAWPVQAAIWYPAATQDGVRLTHGDYRRLAAGGETLAAPTPADDERIASEVRSLARLAFERDIDEREADEVLAVRARAIHHARPSPGKFPLIVGSLGDTSTAWTLAEYLASHGYIVVSAPAISRTVTAQAARPAIALETQARTLEFLYALVHDLPYVDATRHGLIGVNFAGASALLVQSRGMQARAVVTIDGVEGKPHGAGILSASPWFDVVRIRVPYLTVQWDEPTLAPVDYAVFDRLRYADRRSLVIRGLGHLDLVGNLLPWPQIDTVLEVIDEFRLDGIIATNTTLARPGFFAGVNEAGGLGGAPLRQRATEIVNYLSRATRGRLPIVGVGGIMDVASAGEKIDAGATLVHLYTGLIYRGPFFARDLARALGVRQAV